jgi:hypothetical protein
MAATGLEIVGAIASLIQLAEFTLKIYRRVDEFQSDAREIPKSLQQLSCEIPLLTETLQQLTEAIENGPVSDKIQTALTLAVKGCSDQVQSLNIILEKTLPGPDDSRGTKFAKALTSLSQDSKVQRKVDSIRNYLNTLTFYLVASSNSFRPATGSVSWIYKDEFSLT